jgi:predicted nucleic acid-binding protein
VIVIDASARREVLLNRPASGKVAERLFAGNDTLHVPHLIDLDVAQVLRRYTHSGETDAQRSEQALEDLADLAILRYPHDVPL